MKFSWHFFWVLAVGYILGYYFPVVAKMTVGKLYPSNG